MKPKRTQIRSRLCGRVKRVTTPAAVAGQGTAAKSKSGLAIAASGRGRYPIPCQTRGTVADAREGTGTAAGRWPSARDPVLLLASKHRVLQALRQAELAHALGRDLDGLAGLRVPTDPRFAVREDQLPEARQKEHAALLRFPGREVERLVEDALDLLPGEAGLLRKVRDRCRLRHRLRHRCPPVDRGWWWLNANCIISTGRPARLPAREAEFSRSDQSAIRAEARLRVL